MKAKIVILAAFLILLYAGFLFDRTWIPQTASLKASLPAQAQEKTVPDFLFIPLTREKPVAIRSFSGKKILLNFWATWCAPCIAEFPRLVRLADHDPKKLVIIAISVDEKEADIKKFLQRFDPESLKHIYISWDKDKAITHDLFQTFIYPETIVIDEHQNMTEKIPGVLSDEKTREILDGL